jgi:hypothetical protein
MSIENICSARYTPFECAGGPHIRIHSRPLYGGLHPPQTEALAQDPTQTVVVASRIPTTGIPGLAALSPGPCAIHWAMSSISAGATEVCVLGSLVLLRTVSKT